ncbi:MAG TPA: hypothetical protein PK728_00885 [Bacillota bacterium]|nr:hypothetical protein [Bacillota bacterium]
MKKPAGKTWVERFERVLIRLAVVSAAAVMLVQALFAGNYREQAAVPAISSEPVKNRIESEDILHNPVVTLQLKDFSSLPLARVLVNGEARGTFKDRYVTLHVKEGDLLEIDGTRYELPFEVEVLDISKELDYPPAGTEIRVGSGINSIGKVSLRGR